MTRLLLIGDSHIKEMHLAIKKLSPDTRTYSLILGRGVNEIAVKYRAKLPEILQFDPTIFILHAATII
jgi:hypothetical protein